MYEWELRALGSRNDPQLLFIHPSIPCFSFHKWWLTNTKVCGQPWRFERSFGAWATNMFSFLFWMQESEGRTKVHFHQSICTGVASLPSGDISSGPAEWSHRLLGFQMCPSDAVCQNWKLIDIFESLLSSKEQELFFNFLQRSEFKLA